VPCTPRVRKIPPPELHQLSPTTGELPHGQSAQTDAADHVDRQLHAVVPDDRAHSAEDRVERRGSADGEHRVLEGETGADLERERGEEQTQAVTERPGDQERRARELARRTAEARAQEFVGRDEPSTEVARKERRGHQHATDHVADGELHQPHVAALDVGPPRQRQEARGGRLGGDDRAADRPPGQRPRTQQVVVERTLASADPQPQGDDTTQVHHEHGQIDRVPPHGTQNRNRLPRIPAPPGAIGFRPRPSTLPP
jgi:hypothetical protein